jgi:YD repeat-containing protein
MRSHIFFKIILLCALLLPVPLFSSNALAECALVLTSPADGAVFTGSGNQVTIHGYVKAEVDPGYGYIELTNNGQYVQRWEGTFTSANFVLESGAVVVTLSEGENRIEVVGDAAGCPSQAYDAITVYYTPGAETGPDANLGDNPEKGDGPPKCQNFAGDPVNIATGNVTLQATDFSSVTPGIHPALQLSFARSYNSRTDYSGPLGHGWTHTYDLVIIPSEAGGLVGVRRGSGQVLYFQDTGGGTFSAPKGVHNQLALVSQQYLFTTVEKIVHTFNEQGRLLSIADQHGNTLTMQYSSVDFPERLTGVGDAFGRTLQFEYGYNSGRITKMTDPGGGEYLYSYGTTAEEQAKRNLAEVIYPSDGEVEKISYEYNDPADEHNLTAVVDENGHRYTYSYDSGDRAVSSADEGGGTIALDWSAADSTELTNGRGYSMIHSRTMLDGIGYITGIAPAAENGGGCSSCGAVGGYAYDALHNLSSVTDARGVTRSFTYDSRGNMLTLTEAEGTALERLTTYTPHPVFNKPATVTRQSADTPAQSAVTQFSYDAGTGSPLSITVNGYADGQAESRTVTFPEYTAHGQLKKIDGPRTDVTDVTVFAYYSDTDTAVFNRAMLYRRTDASGGTTEFSGYNHFGQPGQITDVNGVITQLSHDARGRGQSAHLVCLRQGRQSHRNHTAGPEEPACFHLHPGGSAGNG